MKKQQLSGALLEASETPPLALWLRRRTWGLTEDVDPKGETVPDQVKPLELILQHQMQGIPSPQFNGVYLGEDSELLELSKLDAVETMELRQSLADKIAELEKDFHQSTRRLAELQSGLNNPDGNDATRTETKSKPVTPDSKSEQKQQKNDAAN